MASWPHPCWYVPCAAYLAFRVLAHQAPRRQSTKKRGVPCNTVPLASFPAVKVMPVPLNDPPVVVTQNHSSRTSPPADSHEPREGVLVPGQTCAPPDKLNNSNSHAPCFLLSHNAFARRLCPSRPISSVGALYAPYG